MKDGVKKMTIKQLNEKIYKLEAGLKEVENNAVKSRVIEMTIKPLKKQIKVKILKRQHLAKTLPVSDEIDKILMAI
jgi:hypothetical protein